MKYKQQILSAFTRLKKSPRGNQLAQINEIVSAYLDEGFTNVILNASTGAGKSIIGAIVAEVLHQNDPLLVENRFGELRNSESSFILMGTNILVNQYKDTFKDHPDYIQVLGATNYECSLLGATGADCCRTILKKSNDENLLKLVSDNCYECPFALVKQRQNSYRNLITNYSYFFIDNLFIKRLSPRTITIWDEAHTVNDAFCEHCTVYISVSRLETMYKDIVDVLAFNNLQLLSGIKTIIAKVKNNQVTEKNYLDILFELVGYYSTVVREAERATDFVDKNTDLKEHTNIKRIAKKYTDFRCKINDFFDYQFEHIFEAVPGKEEFSIKPIFVGQMFNQLINSKFQLFMSATVSETLLMETLGLNKKETKFIKLAPTFPPSNKKIFIKNTAKLNYLALKDKNVVDRIGNECFDIAKKHISQGASGIILTPSFALTETIASYLSKTGGYLIEHKPGEKLHTLVNEFKDSTRPSILISPSLFEGISLDDELSRWQIIVKAPYGSLGDKRVKYILDHHPNLYALSAILKIVQGCGRSVRSETDSADTYFLDSNLSNLWNDRLNIWSDEFEIVK